MNNMVTDFKKLGEQYENKVNFLIDENYSLKNKITHLENQKQHNGMKIRSLESTIQAYEERDQDDNYGSKAQTQEIEDLKNRIIELQTQMDKM